MSRYRYELIVCGLIAVTWLVFGRAVGFDFVGIDDPEYVTGNRHVLDGLSAANVAWAFTTFATANWHPLTWLSLMADADLGGGGPAVFHFTNVVLHTMTTVLLFHVLWRMTSALWSSALVAALFAVHPLHVESVAWIAERKDVLSAFFWFLTILAYVRWVRRPGGFRYGLILASMALGLLAKPMLVTLPLVLMLLDYWPLRRPFAPREKLPLFGLAALSSAVTLLAQSRGGAVGSLELYPVHARLGNALYSYGRYLAGTLWPFDLAVAYPYEIEALTFLRVGGSAALVVAVTWLAIRGAKKHPHVFVGWLWFLLTILPVIGIVQVGAQSMADRYTYIPLVGLFVLLVWSVSAAIENAPVTVKRGVATAAVLAMAFLGVRAHDQVGVWRDTKTLCTHALEVTQRNGLAHSALALALAEEGRPDEAIDHYRQALAIWPNHAVARRNLAALLLRTERNEESVREFRAALRQRPDDESIEKSLAVALVRIGASLMREGRYGEAERQLREALRLDPGLAPAHTNLGVLLARSERYAEAEPHFREALRLDPSDEGARANLERVLGILGDRAAGN